MSKLAISVLAPAKINLSLAIGDKQASGYHELLSVMQQVELADTVEVIADFTCEKSQINFKLSLEDASHTCYSEASINSELSNLTQHVKTVPANSDNLCVKAAELYLAEFAISAQINIKLTKRIPAEAGLAGGSTDAAATLKALALLHQEFAQTPESKAKIATTLPKLASKLGSDVYFCLVGGTAEVKDTGETVTPLPPLEPFTCLLIKPNFGISTAQAFSVLDQRREEKKEKSLSSMSDKLILEQQDLAERFMRLVPQLEAYQLQNDFTPIVCDLKPDFACLYDLVLATNPLFMDMTGSGSTIFALYPSDLEADNAIYTLERTEKAKNLGCTYFLTKIKAPTLASK